MNKIANILNKILWFLGGMCEVCGGELEEPYSWKKQYCSECGAAN